MWFAARVKNNHEFAVVNQLSSHGIESYFPTYSTKNSRSKQIQRPIFSGYVFCRRVFETPGIAGFVTFQGKAAPIPDDEIEILREIETEGKKEGYRPGFKAGMEVEVVRGPFMGIRGILARLKGHSRLIMSPADGRFGSFEIDDSQVRAI